MNLRNVDLNLLVTLDALLAERNVSRAARRVGLSQPAMSGALGRLRRLFGDALLVRVGRELVLTPCAEDLVAPVRDILDRIERTIQQRPAFDPATDARTFFISASDYATLILLGPFLRILATEAPGVTIHLIPRSDDVRRLLSAGQADLVIEPRELLGETDFPSHLLFRDRFLCAVDARNPRVSSDRITRDEYLDLPHLVYSLGADRQLNLADQHLAQLAIDRRIEVSVESFLLVPFLIQGTPLVSLVLERAVRRLPPPVDIRILEPPFTLPEIHETMYWHPRRAADPGHRWLRERLGAAAAEMRRVEG